MKLRSVDGDDFIEVEGDSDCCISSVRWFKAIVEQIKRLRCERSHTQEIRATIDRLYALDPNYIVRRNAAKPAKKARTLSAED